MAAAKKKVAKLPALPKGSLVITNDLSLHALTDIDQQLPKFLKRADELEAGAARAIIDSPESYQRGSEFKTVCAAAWNQLEVLRKAVKGPLDDYIKLIQSRFNPLLTRITAADTIVTERMKAFLRAEEKRQQQEAADLRRKAEEEAAALAAQAKQQGNEEQAQAILDTAAAMPAPVPQKAGAYGGNTFGQTTSAVRPWKGQVADAKAILRAILEEKVPMIVIEFKQMELNTIARQVAVEGVHHGIKCYRDMQLVNR